jgi:uncharacterized membrane protein
VALVAAVTFICQIVAIIAVAINVSNRDRLRFFKMCMMISSSSVGWMFLGIIGKRFHSYDISLVADSAKSMK